MRINIEIDDEVSRKEFAQVKIFRAGSYPTYLDLNFSHLKMLGEAPPVALDFLFVSALIYSIDKYVLRKSAHTTKDYWTRELEVCFPVSESERWNTEADSLSKCISFLTGDVWDISFCQLNTELIRLEQGQNAVINYEKNPQAVSLFSGGLDSLVGVIDWLENNKEEKLLLVGHYDPDVSGPKSDQDRLFAKLIEKYPEKIAHIAAGVGQSFSGEEVTFRSRSILFIALGVYVASSFSNNAPLLIPENGTIALNVPLTPSRRGSCSTRTAHPYYLNMLQGILGSLGLNHQIHNPLSAKSKGQVVATCKNQGLLSEIAVKSVSCAKRGHKRWWVRRNASSCGRCMPCIYRRAALHTIGLDTEIYGFDICQGEVDPFDKGEGSKDFRACLSFLKGQYTQGEIVNLLRKNGPTNVGDLHVNAQTVEVAMNEIRTLIEQKGINKVKEWAGIVI